MEPVPAVGLEGVAPEERERRRRVDLRRDAELLGEEGLGGDDLLEDRAAADEPGTRGAPPLPLPPTLGASRSRYRPRTIAVVDAVRAWAGIG